METVAMFGPSLRDPSQIVNRDIPVADIQAYKAAGYQLGSVPEPLVYTHEDAIAQNDGEDVTAAVTTTIPKTRGRKR